MLIQCKIRVTRHAISSRIRENKEEKERRGKKKEKKKKVEKKKKEERKESTERKLRILGYCMRSQRKSLNEEITYIVFIDHIHIYI